MEPLELSFILITIAAILCMGFATRQWIKISLLFFGWTSLTGVLAAAGFYLHTSSIPPRILTVLLPSMALVIYLYRSFANGHLDLGWLIGIHLLRIPVELILHRLYLEEFIPELMTYLGWNFDILSGVSAFVILVLYRRGRLTPRVLRIWNWIALLLLIIIVLLAILSTPTILQFLAYDQPNMAVMYFPFVWLPAVVVPLVFLSHLLIFKAIEKTQHIS